MFAPRPIASPVAAFCVFLFVVLCGAGCLVAEAASPSSANWQAAGSTPATWRMPTETSHEPGADAPSNPLRPKRAPDMLPEPAAFKTPDDAAPLSASIPKTTVKSAKPAATHSAAVTPAAATVPRKPAVAAATFDRPAASQRPASVPQPARGGISTSSFQRPTIRPPTARAQRPARVAQRSTLAMQPTENWEGDVEDLPLPDRASVVRPDPFGPVVVPGHGGFHGVEPYHPHYPYPHPYGACADGVCCGDPLCDDRCCHPADFCNEDLFCIGPGDDESCHTIRVRVPKVQEAMIFAGVQGFKNPYDQDRDGGNFGFHEGFNISGKVPYSYVGYQYGWRGTHNQLNGDKHTGDPDSHFQQFATAGLFRRADDGLQFGVVWDMLHDERFEARTFHQLRSEVSFVDCRTHEFGVGLTFGLNRHHVGQRTFEATDQYLLFYRMHGRQGGEGRFYVGFNNDSDGILGADMLLPVQDRWSVMTGFAYLVPDVPRGAQGGLQEAWNISLSVVWHWDGRARKSHFNPYRPLFNVADNGYLIVNGR